MSKGNLPFGCILVHASGQVVEEGENMVVTARDLIVHCEIKLLHPLAGKYDREFLNSYIVYASTEPCPRVPQRFSGAGLAGSCMP